jgi:hypothetical protein
VQLQHRNIHKEEKNMFRIKSVNPSYEMFGLSPLAVAGGSNTAARNAAPASPRSALFLRRRRKRRLKAAAAPTAIKSTWF